jgi:hypothetical protein
VVADRRSASRPHTDAAHRLHRQINLGITATATETRTVPWRRPPARWRSTFSRTARS